MFLKIGVLKNFVIFTGKHLWWSLFLIKLQAWRPLLKETPTQVFSCENSEIFQNSFLYRASLVAASDVSRLNPLDYLTYSWLCSLSQITWIHQNTRFFNIQKQPPEVTYKTGVLKNYARFKGKHLCWSLFLNKVAGLRLATIKKEAPTQTFPVYFEKFS